MYLLAIYIPSLEKCLFKVLCPYFNEVVYFVVEEDCCFKFFCLISLNSLSDACAFLGMLSASLFSSLQWAVFSCFFIYFVIFLLLLLLKIGHLEEKQQPLPVFVDWLWAGFTLHQFPGCALGLEVSLS